MPRETPGHRSAGVGELLVHVVNLALLLLAWAYAVATYDELPDRIPTHFGLGGEPDAWSSRSWGSWLALPIVATTITALLYATTRLVDWARRHPALLSLPHKEAFLALPQEQQAPIWARLKRLIVWLAAPTNGLMLVILWSAGRVATGEQRSLTLWPVWLMLGVLLVVTIAPVVSISLAIKRAIAAAESGR